MHRVEDGRVDESKDGDEDGYGLKLRNGDKDKDGITELVNYGKARLGRSSTERSEPKSRT